MATDQPECKEFTGMASQMRDSDWLASEDFKLPDAPGYSQEVVTIEKVLERHNVTFEGGRKKPRVWTLRLREKERELVINATNREILKKLFGPDSKKWLGKKILFWVDETVKLKGEKKPGIRIKPAPESKPEPKSEPKPAPPKKPDPITAFRSWLETRRLTETDACQLIEGRTLEQATETDWQVLRTWAREQAKGASEQ